MNTQPEAIKFAKILEEDHLDIADYDDLAAELRRLHAIEDAAKNLVKVRGHYHTEQAFNQLKELLK